MHLVQPAARLIGQDQARADALATARPSAARVSLAARGNDLERGVGIAGGVDGAHRVGAARPGRGCQPRWRTRRVGPAGARRDFRLDQVPGRDRRARRRKAAAADRIAAPSADDPGGRCRAARGDWPGLHCWTRPGSRPEALHSWRPHFACVRFTSVRRRRARGWRQLREFVLESRRVSDCGGPLAMLTAMYCTDRIRFERSGRHCRRRPESRS